MRKHRRRIEFLSRTRHDCRNHVLLARRPGQRAHAIHVDIVHQGALGHHFLDVAGVDEIPVMADSPALAVIEEQPMTGLTGPTSAGGADISKALGKHYM